MMYINYEYDGYKFTLVEENSEDIVRGYRTYTLFKNGNYLKNVHIAQADVEDNFVLRYKFNDIIHELKKKQQFPCDCYACGAELNEYGMPKYKWEKNYHASTELNKYKDIWGNSITLEQMDKQMNYKQMTRQEVINLLNKNPFEPLTMNDLEKLGLIKFEEEKKNVIQKAEDYVACVSSPEARIIKGLLEELEKRPKIGESVIVVTPNTYREVIGYFKGKSCP